MKVIFKVWTIWAHCVCRSLTARIKALCNIPGVFQASEWSYCCVTVLYRESCQSVILPIVRCVQHSIFELKKHLSCCNLSPTCWNLWGNCHEQGECVSGVICLIEEGQMCTTKHNLNACLSPLRIGKSGLMLTFMKICNSLLISLIKYCHMLCNLLSIRLTQFSPKTEAFVSDGFQDCSQTNTSIRSERNSYRLAKWTGSQLLWWGDCHACVTFEQLSELQWGR
jgi:hypothetical protein